MVSSFPLILGVYDSCVILLFPKIFFFCNAIRVKSRKVFIWKLCISWHSRYLSKFLIANNKCPILKSKTKNTEMRRYWIAKWWRFLTWMVVLCKCSHILTHTYTSYLLFLSSFPYAVRPCGCLFNTNSASYNSGCAKYLKFLAWQMQSLVPLFIHCNYFHIAFKEYSYTILI